MPLQRTECVPLSGISPTHFSFNFLHLKITTGTVLDILSHWRTFFYRNNAFRNYGKEEPLRSELYSRDQMVRHGAVLAAAHKLLPGKCNDQLLKRLDDNEHILNEVRNMLVESLGS